MPKRGSKKAVGGAKEMFPTAHWTDISHVQLDDEVRRDAALGELLGTYWRPVYCYLRRKGHAHEGAKDLTQGFFYEVVLGLGLIQQAERARGRFRTFLLTALDRYATSVHRAETAERRMPEGGLVSLQEIDWLSLPEQVDYVTPMEAFDHAWASALLDQVPGEAARECREAGKATHWEVFRARVLQPIMDNAEPPSLADLCEKYGISNEAKASNMIITVKRRFQAALRHHVRESVESDAEVDEEIRDLMKIFCRGGAGS